MAPGTTFYARCDLRGLPDEYLWMVYRAPGYSAQVISAHGVGNIAPDRIDPSTIREITPPKDAA
jgi:hypothetical protein